MTSLLHRLPLQLNIARSLNYVPIYRPVDVPTIRDLCNIVIDRELDLGEKMKFIHWKSLRNQNIVTHINVMSHDNMYIPMKKQTHAIILSMQPLVCIVHSKLFIHVLLTSHNCGWLPVCQLQLRCVDRSSSNRRWVANYSLDVWTNETRLVGTRVKSFLATKVPYYYFQRKFSFCTIEYPVPPVIMQSSAIWWALQFNSAHNYLDS